MKRRERALTAGCRFLPILVGLLAAPGCRGEEAGPPPASTPAAVSLPVPSVRGEVSVEAAIQNRLSVRSFSPRPLDLREVSQLLWAAGGKTIDGVTGPTRSYPSAGGIYSLSILLVVGSVSELPPGIYRYDWKDNTLRLQKPGDHRVALARAAHGQGCVARAPVSIVIAGDIQQTASRYGERGENRYVSMNAGHSGQNVSLQARALGAFRDDEVKEVLGLEGETPLYLIPVGRPASN